MSEASDDRFRCSFDSVADAYERSRPSYAPEALAWISEQLPLRRVLDLGAGTGKLTRQLLALGAEVVAVEPGEEMLRILRDVAPEVESHAGSAEAIPLPDGSVDAVTVAQAFHWFRIGEALAEMHRVLRPGGGYALLWNRWDERDPLMRELSTIVDRLRERPARDEAKRDELVSSPLFRDHEERGFPHADEVAAQAAVERVASISALAAADTGRRDDALDEVGKLVGTGTVRFPMITTVALARRV